MAWRTWLILGGTELDWNADSIGLGFVINVLVVAADSLAKRDVFRLPDPFAIVTVDGEQTKTTAAIKVSQPQPTHTLNQLTRFKLFQPID